MATIVSARTAGRLGVAAGMLALALVPSPAHALGPVPLPSLDPAAVTGLLASPSPSPSPSPSASPAPGALDPVISALPSPVSSPVQQAASSVPTAAPAPAPGTAPAAGSAPAGGAAPTVPGGTVRPNQAGTEQQVAAPSSGVAAFPRLQPGSFPYGSNRTLGLPPLTAGLASSSLDRLLGVPDVAQPVAVLPAAAPAASHSDRTPLPGGLPALVVVLAVVTVGGAAAGHVGLLRARRTPAA